MKAIVKKRDLEAFECRRFEAIKLIKSGLLQAEVARQMGVTEAAVSQWFKVYKEKGEEGLKAKRRCGRPTKLPPNKLSMLPQLLKEGAPAFGYSTNLWTTKRIAKLIWDQFGIRYHYNHIGRLLQRLGWSYQKPIKKATKKDEEAIRTWVEKKWPHIKKKPKE